MKNSNNEFGLKELYDVVIKATSDIEINGRIVHNHETLAAFDKIQLAYFDDQVVVRTAHGGWDDRDHVWWESTKNVAIRFTQGIFSKDQWSIMTNAKLAPIEKEKDILLYKREIVESDEKGLVTFSFEPVDYLFIYDKKTGKAITDYQVMNSKSVKVSTPFQELLLDYGYLYNNGGSIMTIGQQLVTGFVTLEGRTRLKDDITGQVRTGIVSIPKMKLMSNISIRLGSEASPVVGQMEALALPMGDKGKSRVMDLIFLNDDIDSDM